MQCINNRIMAQGPKYCNVLATRHRACTGSWISWTPVQIIIINNYYALTNSCT
jgi:hypothetical protein